MKDIDVNELRKSVKDEISNMYKKESISYLQAEIAAEVSLVVIRKYHEQLELPQKADE